MAITTDLNIATHIVTDCRQTENDDYYAINRTIILLIAVSRKIPLVSSDWIKFSLLGGSILGMKKFLTVGLRINGLYIPFNTKDDIARLFKNTAFFMNDGENYAGTANELEMLIINCGGSITKTLNPDVFAVEMAEDVIREVNHARRVSVKRILDSVSLNRWTWTEN